MVATSVQNYYVILNRGYLKLLGTKVVVMPYGGDVQDLRLCNNLNFIHSITQDYPMFQKSSIHTIKTNIDRWIKHANHVIMVAIGLNICIIGIH